ncbi:MAG: hypothetical protein M3Z08_10550 [Chloroflexota bacterium]|nr:hypothetical protein [Chloroflexota bacterium]
MARPKKKQPTAGDVMVISGIATLMALAIREQLQMPPEERTWHGTLYGIPYDFRRPTIERLRETFWNKDTARVLVPQFFGMGWSINFYPLINPPTAEHMPETPVTRISRDG